MMRHLFSRMLEVGRNIDIRPKPKPAKPDPMAEVDKALNISVKPEVVLPPVTHPARKTSKAGIDLLHQFEGCAKVRPDGKVEAYLCPAGVWTIGWGSTGNDPFNGGKIGKGTVWTKEQCDTRFEQHLVQFERAVLDGLGNNPASQAQFDAMVCLTYNIGPAAFARSTVLRKHNGGDFPAAEKAFLMWNKAGGKVLRGLIRRREAEAALYRSGS
ncbi:COG3772 Phage-related lysozyme (muraminidase) [uncultured Caudovirales phage]|uniref:Endolysin n=1 Tax=uncultured Caudovirales phage TaxID=2100421 RepID=A0A6J5M318_9CAUD|nr:COG3772 Phage-related lysozyme (muraminidase) [uncultured Caudovirales phage]